MRAPGAIEQLDLRIEVAGCAEIARPKLVLLRIHVLLAPRLHGHILAELEAAVDPVQREQCRREQQPHAERFAAAVLQVLVQDVRRVREQVPAHVLRRGPDEVRHQLDELRTGVLPREIRVRLREPRLREVLHLLRARECFGEEDHIGMRGLHFTDHPLPERCRLRMRIVHAERPHPVPDPVEQHVAAGIPEILPIRAPEVEWKDVLVLLRRVLRVLDRSVRADVKPVGMILHPRMIGRTLQCVVERDFESELCRRGDKPVEVVDGAERGLDRVVPPVLVADCPRTADVGGRRHERVVLPLPRRPADRMNRRKVHDVKAELRDAWQLLCGVGEGAMLAGHRTLRAREQLVPRGESRAQPIDDQLDRVWKRCEVVRCVVRVNGLTQRVGERDSPSRVPCRGLVAERLCGCA